jgi:hypothetical protein
MTKRMTPEEQMNWLLGDDIAPLKKKRNRVRKPRKPVPKPTKDPSMKIL